MKRQATKRLHVGPGRRKLYQNAVQIKSAAKRSAHCTRPSREREKEREKAKVTDCKTPKQRECGFFVIIRTIPLKFMFKHFASLFGVRWLYLAVAAVAAVVAYMMLA